MLLQKATSANAFSPSTSLTAMAPQHLRLTPELAVGPLLLLGCCMSILSVRLKSNPRLYLLEDIQNSQGVTGLTLDTAINVIYLDFTRRIASTPLAVPPVLVLGIDEVNLFYTLDQAVFRNFVHAIGGISCKVTHPFCIPILSGTIQGPLEEMVQESTYHLLQLPLPLLTEVDVITIGRALYLTRDNIRIHLPNQYLQNNHLFRRTIADIGGMARAIEVFYQQLMMTMGKGQEIPKQEEALVDYLNHLDVVEVMMHTSLELERRYQFEKYVEFTGPALANAILSIPIDIESRSKNITYKELRSAGIINLEGVHFNILSAFHTFR